MYDEYFQEQTSKTLFDQKWQHKTYIEQIPLPSWEAASLDSKTPLMQEKNTKKNHPKWKKLTPNANT